MDYLLLEDGFYLLQEDGFKIILELVTNTLKDLIQSGILAWSRA